MSAPLSAGSYWIGSCVDGVTSENVLNNQCSAGVAISVTIFTDDPLMAGVTLVRAIHFQEMRDHVDALRSSRALPATSWTDPTLTIGALEVAVLHLNEIRSALDAVYAFDGVPAPTYTNPAIFRGDVIRAVDITELRSVIVARE